MKKTLGQVLKEGRELLGFTLGQVEYTLSISNAYLSQLENDKIKMPSANVLYKLLSLYKIDLDVLLYAAGIIKDNPGKVNGLIAGLGKLTTEEEKALIDYLRYLRHKK